MPRAHLSKRLSDSDAIRLFAEHHIVQVRRRKNGEIVAVKHAALGWMGPQEYYSLQKAHDFLPLLQEFVHGGYRAKQALWSFNVDVLGISVPIGSALPVIETWNLYQELIRRPIDPAMLLLRLYALVGPWGDVIQIIDSVVATEQGVEGGLAWLIRQIYSSGPGPPGPPAIGLYGR